MQAAKQINMYPILSENKNVDNISFIPIKRSFFDHFLWQEKRIFSKCEAWLDLIQMARFEQSQAKKLLGGKLIKWNRGELPASIRFLSQRWEWGTHKVLDFLQLLEDEQMIKRDNSQGQTVITLLNYEEHNKKQGREQQGEQLNEPPVSVSAGTWNTEGNKQGTSGDQTGNETNKENKENKERVSHEKFYKVQIQANLGHELIGKYQNFIALLKGNNKEAITFKKVLSMQDQITFKEYISLREKVIKHDIDILDILKSMENKKKLLQENSSLYLTANSWINFRLKDKK